MMELVYSAYVITKKELYFLAGAMGIRQLYGVLDGGTPDDAELYVIMKNLIRKGFITTDSDSFVIDGELREHIKIMAESDKPMLIYDPNGSIPPKCVYSIGDTTVICEACHASENDLRLYKVKTDEVQRLISSGAYIVKEGERFDDTN